MIFMKKVKNQHSVKGWQIYSVFAYWDAGLRKYNVNKKSYSACKMWMYIGACSYGVKNVCVWVWIHMRL